MFAEDQIKINLRICKSRLISKNELQYFSLPSNAQNSTNTTLNWKKKLPPKEVNFQELSSNMKIKGNSIKTEFKMLENKLCTLV